MPLELRTPPHEIVIDDRRRALERSPVIRIEFLDVAFPGSENRFRSDNEHRPRAARPDEFGDPHEDRQCFPSALFHEEREGIVHPEM